MQFEHLKTFCDLAETKSFTNAARIKGVTQSAVSQQITALEKHFDCLLVERSKNNFRLTPEGQVLYDCSKPILQAYDAIQGKMQHLKSVISGKIRVSTVFSIGLHDLPPYIERFRKDYPDVNVQVKYRRANLVYEDVLANSADIGLVAYPASGPQLEIVPLRKDPLVLICHPQHPFAKRKTIMLTEISGQKLIGFEADMPTRQALDKVFKEQGVTAAHIMEFDHIEALKRAVEIDSGVAIVPERTIRREVKGQTLAAVYLQGREWVRQLGVIYRKNKVLSPAMDRLIELLKNPI
ncbi:MAG: LysR family transcriptional regulator [Verrucomicrobiota bacterium]